MIFRVVHSTRYRYSQPVTLCHNEAHLRPRDGDGQVCEASTLSVSPLPARRHERSDYFGNPTTYFVVQQPHAELTVTATSHVRREAVPQLPVSMAWDTVHEGLAMETSDAVLMAREMALPSSLVSPTPLVHAYALPSFEPGRPLLEAVLDLSRRIHRDFLYTPSSTTVSTPLHTVLEQRRGVCQDFAHLGIGCLRALGLPARYVSGYIESLRGRIGAEASHAWFAAYDPIHGWIDFDPTNNQIVGAQHVTTAWGRDYADVAPLKGIVFGGGAHTLEVEVQMTALAGENA